ncbi:MAG: hypothetical protein LBJ94_02475 [Puniceicoccales bacterium]|jgi:ribosome assembly protein YihI (activator of Der GTPase)|nr:hypothetical protein [Puniceicoccales bacterium]
METNNFTRENGILGQRLVDLDLALQELRAFVDQKIDHIETNMENLELRINNLR